MNLVFQNFSKIFKNNVLFYLFLNSVVLFFHLLFISSIEFLNIQEIIGIIFVILVLLVQFIVIVTWKNSHNESPTKLSLLMAFSTTVHFYNNFYFSNENGEFRFEIHLLIFISVSLMKNIFISTTAILFIVFFYFFKWNMFKTEKAFQITMYFLIAIILIIKTNSFSNNKEIKKRKNTKQITLMKEIKENYHLKKSKQTFDMIKKPLSLKQTQSFREIQVNSCSKEISLEISKKESHKDLINLQSKNNLEEKLDFDEKTKFYCNIISSTIQEGIIVFDKNLIVKWKNEHMNTLFNISKQLPIENLELSKKILSIKQDEKYLKSHYNLMKSKCDYESLVKVFQTRLATLKSNDVLKDLNSMTSYTQKEKNFGKISHRTLVSSKFSKKKDIDFSHDKFVYFLNKNIQNKLSMSKSLILKDLKNYLEDIFDSHSKKLHSNSLENFHKYNFYGTFSEEYEDSKLFSIRLFPYKEEVLILFKLLEEKDLMHNFIKESESQNKLLASMCHELRTPLNFIINILEIMQNDFKGKDNENSHDEYINFALVNSKLLINAVNDFLDYFSISSSIFHLEEGHFIFEEVIRESYNLFLFMAKQKNIEYLCNYDENIPLICYNDNKRIKQIILNLLNNAFKFSESGTVILKAKRLAKSNYIEISVRDTGIGIPEKNLTKLAIFSSESSSQQTGGFGLCISNLLANYVGPHNSCFEDSSNYYRGLKLKTEFGKGSKFSFLVFIADNNTACLAEKDSIANKTNQTIYSEHDMKEIQNFNEIHCANLHFIKSYQNDKESYNNDKELSTETKNNKEIKKQCSCFQLLAVDDNEFNLFVLKEKFKKFGISIDVAKSGNEAIEKIKTILVRNEISIFCPNCKFYKLVLMDIDMPVKNGYETTEDLIELFNQYSVITPIVAVSAFSQIDYKKKAKKAGMFDYIEKPLTNEKFLILIKQFIE